MVDILGRLPQIMRALFALGFGAFWGYLAITMGPMAGPATQFGVGAMAIVSIVFGVIGLIRSTAPSGESLGKTIGSTSQDCEAFDADAVLERYLARKNGR